MEQKDGGGVRPLVWVLIALNAVVLLALAWLALSAVNQVREVESRVESLTDAIGNIEGGDRLLDRVGGNDSSADLADVEARLDVLEGRAGQGSETQPDTPSSAPDDEASLGSSDDVILQVFPELEFDGTMSDDCLSEMSAQAGRYNNSIQQVRRTKQRIESSRGVPYSMLHDEAFALMHDLMDGIAYRRGWSEWNRDSEEYRVYNRSEDVDGSGPSASVPCTDERKQITRFQILRAANPMGRFRSETLAFHWQCAYEFGITPNARYFQNRYGSDYEEFLRENYGGSYDRYFRENYGADYEEWLEADYGTDEQYIQTCKTHNERYAQWLPPLPELSR